MKTKRYEVVDSHGTYRFVKADEYTATSESDHRTYYFWLSGSIVAEFLNPSSVIEKVQHEK